MRLYTMITYEEFMELCVNGRLVCDHNRNDLFCYDCDEIVKAYNWMSSKLNDKIQHPIDVKYPRWAWYKIDGKQANYNTVVIDEVRSGVLLELSVSQERCLLSDFDLWHFVLNDVYNYDTDEQWDEYKKKNINEKEQIKIKSWDKCLDVSKSNYIQAVFWEILQSDVKKVWSINNGI